MFMEKQKKLKRDVFSSLSVILISVVTVAYLIPNYIVDVNVAGMSPRFFPLLGAVSTGLFALYLFLISLFSLKALSIRGAENISVLKAGKFAYEKHSSSELSQLKLPVIILVILVLFCFLFEMFGYVVAAPLAVTSLMFAYGQRRIFMLFVLSPLVSIVLFLTFEYGLNFPLR